MYVTHTPRHLLRIVVCGMDML